MNVEDSKCYITLMMRDKTELNIINLFLASWLISKVPFELEPQDIIDNSDAKIGHVIAR